VPMDNLVELAAKIEGRCKSAWKLDRSYFSNIFITLIFLLFSLWINSLANNYTETHAGHSVSDLILNHLPVVDVNFIVIDGMVMFWILLILILIYHPKWIPFTVKGLALFLLIRSFFITLTHLGPPAHHLVLNMDSDGLISKLTSDDDLFFSAHTGMPFLMALIFWSQKRLRIFCLLCTGLFATSVLLGHLHYSIDVFSAFFITFSIFELARHMFAKDYSLFHHQ
jgi:hypothetical protein